MNKGFQYLCFAVALVIITALAITVGGILLALLVSAGALFWVGVGLMLLWEKIEHWQRRRKLRQHIEGVRALNRKVDGRHVRS